MDSRTGKMISRMTNGQYAFWVTIAFYIILLVINPPNKFIAFSFVPLLLIYNLKIRNFYESLFFVFVSSSIVFTGKTYPIQIVPPGVFQTDIYPYGYIINIVISSSVFIGFVMLITFIRKLIQEPNSFKPNFLDTLLLFFYCLKILSAVLGSKDPNLSLPFEILSLIGLFAYFYIRITLKINNSLWNTLTYLISALIIFESFLGITQLISKSPLGKNIEYQVNFEYYGQTVGETQFTFRPDGTFNHANSFGIWLAAACIFLLASALNNKSLIILLASLTGLAAMITTISRSAWLGFAVGFIFLVIYFRKKFGKLFKYITSLLLKWRIVIVPAVIVLIFLFIIPRINDSFYSFRPDAGGSFFRKIQISDVLEVIKLHPIFGIGAGMSAYEGISLNLYTLTAQTPLEVHNWYLAIALENGLFSLFIIILFILYSLRKIFTDYPKSIVHLTVAGVVFCSMIAGIFQPYFNFGLILLLLALINNDTISAHDAEKNH